MNCPYCGFEDQKVLDSRPAREGEAIRRRRECVHCERRFTTYETADKPKLSVLKRRGLQEDFDRQKMVRGMLAACRKRPVTLCALEDAAARVERELFTEFEDAVPSQEIGVRILRQLIRLDHVAYVRFASVYQDFETLSDFRRLIDHVNQSDLGEDRLVVAASAR